MTELEFPLVRRAAQMGILDGASAVVVAPTATGKSYIGREAILRAIRRGESGTHAYLVPFRALAAEVYDDFETSLTGTNARLRISTGDHRDPLRPDEADLIVATYESFAALVQRNAFRPGVVVADEVHLIADEQRGPVVEGLFARLLSSRRLRTLCALSAVVENGAELAAWLGVPLLEGSPDDRPVPLRLEVRRADDLDEALRDVLRPCLDGEQALVFCSSRARAEGLARDLGPIVAPAAARDGSALRDVAERIRDADETADTLAGLVETGVAYHHAGLMKPVRRLLEEAYRNRLLRIITATPTLAAGVNLPAGVAVVRDIFRSEEVRGFYQRVLLPPGEVVNMLGRAARPHQVAGGRGVALVERRFEAEPEVEQLIAAVESGRGGAVVSRLLDSFEGLMRFVLAVVADAGEASREDIARVFARTLAHHRAPAEIRFDRPFEEDLMEDIPAYAKVVEARGAIRLVGWRTSAAGVQATVDSSGKRYEVTISITGLSCSCPAASQFYRGRICKHQACAIHDLLFGDVSTPGEGTERDEIRHRTLYICGHLFGETLEPGTRLTEALEILTAWRLLERVPGGWRSTPVGEVAAASGFDLLLVHEAVTRITEAAGATYREVARWAVIDYFADEREERRWLDAVEAWIDEVSEREIRLPARYRGDFERGLEDLARVCLLYERAATALGKPDLARAAHDAAGALRYGVAPELVPLMALGFPQLARARTRHLYEQGIRTVEDLATADPVRLADPRRVPEALLRDWVERAQALHRARAVATADREEADAEFDELVSRFRVDPDALRAEPWPA